jgi:hypothetical protein
MARHPAAVANTVPLATRPSGLRWRLLASICLCLLVAGWLAGLTRSGRGWLAIGLAELLVVLLAVHHRDGGRRWLARLLCEYTAVALMVALAATSASTAAGGGGGGGGGGHQAPAPPARHQARSATTRDAGSAAGAIAGQLAGDVRAWFAELWHQAKDKADQQSTPTTTAPSGKHRR